MDWFRSTAASAWWGFSTSGFFDYDSSWAFTRLSDTQNLEGLGDQITVLEFKVDDIYQAGKISEQLEQAAGKGFMATNWMEQNKALFRALRLERLVTFITIGLIVFVAALNILISLTMMVMEKTRDIAVLMSMGTRKSQVRRLFITQGLLIGVIGTAIGLVLGYALSWAGGHYHLAVTRARGLLHRLRTLRPARHRWRRWLRWLPSGFPWSPRCIRPGRRRAFFPLKLSATSDPRASFVTIVMSYFSKIGLKVSFIERSPKWEQKVSAPAFMF